MQNMLPIILVLSFLIPQEMRHAGSVDILYPSNQQYVYADKPPYIPSKQPIRDANEKKARPIITLPLEQIIRAQPNRNQFKEDNK